MPPRVRTSTPQSVVSSRSSRPSASAAFTSRAPSTCRSSPASCAASASAAISAGVYTVPSSVDWEMDTTLACTWCWSPKPMSRGRSSSGVSLPSVRRHVDELGAGDALRRPALVDVDVRRLRADHRLERPAARPQRTVTLPPVPLKTGNASTSPSSSRRRSRRPRRPLVVAVGLSPAVVGGADRLEDGGVRPRVVVAGEEREWRRVHVATFFLSDS